MHGIQPRRNSEPGQAPGSAELNRARQRASSASTPAGPGCGYWWPGFFRVGIVLQYPGEHTLAQQVDQRIGRAIAVVAGGPSASPREPVVRVKARELNHSLQPGCAEQALGFIDKIQVPGKSPGQRDTQARWWRFPARCCAGANPAPAGRPAAGLARWSRCRWQYAGPQRPAADAQKGQRLRPTTKNASQRRIVASAVAGVMAETIVPTAIRP